ncbi:MAG TPA: caspase family protein [Pirellulales bacterium]
MQVPRLLLSSVAFGATVAVVISVVAAEPRRSALLIGINHYRDPGSTLKSLQFACQDQRDFSKALFQSEARPTGLVLLLDDDENMHAEQRLDQPPATPSRENIMRNLRGLVENRATGDEIIFGFSGHGVALNGHCYLCPNDANLHDTSTLVAVDDLYQILNSSRATLKLLFIDACRADGLSSIQPDRDGARGVRAAGGRGLDLNSFDHLLDEQPPVGLWVLNSCGKGQVAMEDSRLQHGVFMHFIIDGLRGKAANHDGAVMLGSLYDYASLETARHARGMAKAQIPAQRGGIDGPVVLLGASPKAAGVPNIPSAVFRVSKGAWRETKHGNFVKPVVLPNGASRTLVTFQNAPEWVYVFNPFLNASNRYTARHPTVVHREFGSRVAKGEQMWQKVESVSVCQIKHICLGAVPGPALGRIQVNVGIGAPKPVRFEIDPTDRPTPPLPDVEPAAVAPAVPPDV